MRLLEKTRKLMRGQGLDWFKPDVTPELDISHRTILHVEGVSVTFDGFKAINNLNLYIDEADWKYIRRRESNSEKVSAAEPA